MRAKRYPGTLLVASAAALLLGLAASPARADQFVIFLRDLEGNLLDQAQLRVFKQLDSGNPNVQGARITMTVNKQADLLAGPLTTRANGRVDVTINVNDVLNRAIVFTARRAGQAADTAAVPFIVVGQNLQHTMHIAVPLEGLPECVADGCSCSSHGKRLFFRRRCR